MKKLLLTFKMVLFVRHLWFSKRMASRNSTSYELVKQFVNRGHVVELTSESKLRKGGAEREQKVRMPVS